MNNLRILKPENTPEAFARRALLVGQRKAILQWILYLLLGIAAAGFAVMQLASPRLILSPRAWAYLAGLAIIAVCTFVRKIPYSLRACLSLLALMGLGTVMLLGFGLSETGTILLFTGILLAYLLLNPKLSLLFTLLSIGIMGLIALRFGSGWALLPRLQLAANSGSLVRWAGAILALLFGVGVISSSLRLILRRISAAADQPERLNRELETEQASRERQINERSTDLARRRLDQFEITRQISQAITGEISLENLFSQTADLISDRFGFYHVGIFINDNRNEYVVLRAATGGPGSVMLERNYRLKIGEIGMVAYAAYHGEARVAMDVDGDVVYYKNPLLPNTRSEMALPLRIGEHAIGVLDVQSMVENAFTPEDERVLQIIAGQLATAIEQAGKVEELTRRLEVLETSTRLSTQKTWRAHLRNTHQRLGYHYHDAQLDNQQIETEQSRAALQEGRPILSANNLDEQGKPYSALAVPIMLRSQALGVVDIRFTSPSVSPELVALIEGTVSRLAVSLENARLLEEIQAKAERERLVSEISTRVRAAPDVDSVLRIAIQEIGKSLGVSEVMVQLRKNG